MNSSTPRDPRALSPQKRRIFFLLTLSIPFLLFLSMEGILRLLDYGPNLDLFVTEERGGKLLYVMNPDVKSRYFFRSDFSPNTSVDYFEVPKPKNRFRIFCLGGSTTVGFPYGPAGSFSAFLQDRVNLLYPGVEIEIINLGMTATNSFTVNDLVRELPSFEPDLILVYDGHNEFYGALGVASYETLGGQRWSTRVFLTLVHVKTFQLVRDVLVSLFSLFSSESEGEQSVSLMEQLAGEQTIPYQSETYRRGLEAFQDNLAELARFANQEGIPVILGTQASNLRDQRPFVPDFDDRVPAPERPRFKALLADANDPLNASRAEDLLLEALAIDSLHADVHFFLGRLYQQQKRTSEALRAFRRARDYDQLRFRASSDFNDAIIGMGQFETVTVADIESAFLRHSADSLIGFDLMLEHLHPNLTGYFLMAKAFEEAMAASRILNSGRLRETINEDSLFAARVTTRLDSIAAMRRIEILTSSWPFTAEARQVRNLPQDDPLSSIVNKLLKAEITWEQAHVEAAEMYERSGDMSEAAREYRLLSTHFPYNVSPLLRLGQLQLGNGDLPAAERTFRRSLRVERTSFALVRLGAILLQTNRRTECLPLFEEAYSTSILHQEKVESGYFLALALFLGGETDRSMRLIQSVLQVDPTHGPSQQLFRQLSERKNR